MRYWLTTMFLVCALAFTAMGQGSSFKATVNKTKVSLNETFQLTYTITNADGRNFNAPPFNNFNKLGGPNKATSMNIVNGQASTSVAYSYYLQPQQEGKYTIPGATIEINGKTVTSNAITIEVVKKGEEPTIEDVVAENVFIRAFIDKKQVYQGEQVTVTYKLYRRIEIYNLSIAESPVFTGFWSQDLDVSNALNFVNEEYQGKMYAAAVIKKTALFAQRSGDLEIEPMSLEGVARVQVEAPSFGNFFGRHKDIPYRFSSDRITVNVKPLPIANKPANFSGFVGKLDMKVSLDKTETETDDPITMSMQFNGTGNLRMLETPVIDLPNDFEVFDPKVAENLSTSGKVRGTKKYDFLIIPRRPGKFKLPPVSIAYFDLTQEKYVTLSSDQYNLSVTGEASTSTSSVSGLNKEEVELIGQDIRYIKTGDTELMEQGNYAITSIEFAGMAIAPFLLFGILVAVRKRQEAAAGDIVGQRKKKATKGANRKLKEAKRLMEAGEQRKFYDEVSRAIWGYLRDKLNIDPSDLSRDQVKAAMLQHGVPQSTIDKTLKVLDECEMAVYAPSGVEGGSQSIYDHATTAIEELEDTLK